MTMQPAIERTLDAYVSSLGLSRAVRQDIARARNDLYNGPSYYTADGDECSYFDEGAIAFDFSASVARIETALDDVSDIYVDTDCEDWSDREPEAEEIDAEIIEPFWSAIYHVERCEIIAHICGHELAKYV